LPAELGQERDLDDANFTLPTNGVQAPRRSPIDRYDLERGVQVALSVVGVLGIELLPEKRRLLLIAEWQGRKQIDARRSEDLQQQLTVTGRRRS
jgi:hypothetical protein